MKNTWVWGLQCCAVIVLACVLLYLAQGAVRLFGRERAPEVRDVGKVEPGQIRALVRSSRIDYYMADVSLAIREHEDFLLTPALLVQEAISDGVILTYPQE